MKNMNNHFAAWLRRLARAAMKGAGLLWMLSMFIGTSAWADAPTISLTAPANNSSYIAPASFRLSATAADSDGSVSVVRFYRNGSEIAGNSGNAQGLYGTDVSDLAAGTYNFTAKAWDNDGNITESAPVTIIVAANTPPTISLTAPANNSSYIAPASFTLSATAADSDGSISVVRFYQNGSVIGGNSGNAQGLYAVNVSDLAAGTYSFTAIAWDNGNTTTQSSPITVVVVPNTPPTISLTAPANNSTYIAPASFRLSATAADSDGSVSVVRFYQNGNVFAGNSGNAQGLYGTDVSGLAAGTYSFTAIAWDNGNTTTQSAPITVVVVPNTPPTISLTAPANNSIYIAPANFRLSATAADSDGSVSVVRFYQNGSEIAGNSGNAQGLYGTTVSNLAAGTYSFTAIAWDNGNTTTQSAAVNVTVYTSLPPAVNISSPANNQVFPPGTNIPLRAHASDSDGTVTQVQFFNGTTAIGMATLNTGTASIGTWATSAWTNVPAGTYTVTAKVTDNTGGVVTSSPVTVIVNSSAVTTVSLAGPPAGTTYTAPASIPLSATAANGAKEIAGVQFFSGATSIGTGYLVSGTATSGAWVTNAWTNVAAGTYSVTAVATDEDGGTVTSTPVTFTVGAASSGASTTLYFIDTDHLNNPRLIENQSQQTVWKWEQAEAFGDSVPNENPSSLGTFVFNQRFPGQYRDVETGLNYNYFRDYDPAIGKYSQSDPIGLNGGTNTYSYVGASPLGRTDSFGLWFDPAAAAATAGAASAAASAATSAASSSTAAATASSAAGTLAGASAIGITGAVVGGGAIGVGLGFGFNYFWERGAGQSFGGSIYDWKHPETPESPNASNKALPSYGEPGNPRVIPSTDPNEYPNAPNKSWPSYPAEQCKKDYAGSGGPGDTCYNLCKHLLGPPGDYGVKYRACYSQCQKDLRK